MRFHIEFDMEGDLSLLMHHLLTLGEQHWKIIGGADGISITPVSFLQAIRKSLYDLPAEVATGEDKEKIMEFAEKLQHEHNISIQRK